MRGGLIISLLWFSAIGCGIIAGLYFSFSAFIMTALARIDQLAGIAAMNAINFDIQRSLFMPIFLGSTFTATVLTIMAMFSLNAPWAAPALLAGVLYVVGMTTVTMIWNVPLNNLLAAAGSGQEDADAVWATYLKDWTRWNTVRAVASTVALALFITSLQRAQVG